MEERIARVEGILEQMDKRLDHIESTLARLDGRIDKLNGLIDSNFRWTLGMIVSMWITIIMAVLFK